MVSYPVPTTGMMSQNLLRNGFDNIIGVNELTEEAALEAGGAWYESVTPAVKNPRCQSPHGPRSWGDNVSKGYADFDDGLRYSVGQLPQKLDV